MNIFAIVNEGCVKSTRELQKTANKQGFA